MTTSKKIAFFMGVYKDQELAKHNIKDIRNIYGDSVDIISISDGVCDRDFESFCDKHSVYYEEGDRRAKAELGGGWTLRMLETSLRVSDFDILVKIDPDTQIKRVFRYIPDSDYFGNIRNGNHLQGGCKGLKRSAVDKILSSGLLLDTKYCSNTEYAYCRFLPPYIRVDEDKSNESLSVEDFILWDVAKILELSIEEWNDIKCFTANGKEIDLSGDYAAIHPVYGR